MASNQPTHRDDYVLGRSHAATLRLNYQHYLWQHAIGSHLHPSIPPLSEHVRIADVATGSGIWLLELAEQLPLTVNLDGLDVSPEQFPPKAWLPSNVTFRTWDFFTKVPPDLIASYDIVHIRLIAVAIKNNDPTVVVKNLSKLLKPGGYLQWDEFDTPTAHVASARPGLETRALEQLRDLLTHSTKGRDGQFLLGPRDWIQAIPDTLTAHEFCDAQKYQYCERPHMAGFWNHLWVLSAEELAEVTLKAGDEETGRALREMALEASSESAAGAAVRYGKMSVVARRKDEV